MEQFYKMNEKVVMNVLKKETGKRSQMMTFEPASFHDLLAITCAANDDQEDKQHND